MLCPLPRFLVRLICSFSKFGFVLERLFIRSNSNFFSRFFAFFDSKMGGSNSGKYEFKNDFKNHFYNVVFNGIQSYFRDPGVLERL
jgi:hypothetical protein